MLRKHFFGIRLNIELPKGRLPEGKHVLQCLKSWVESSEADEIQFGTLSMCWRQNCAPWSLTTPPSLAHSLPVHLSGRQLLVIAAGTFSLAQLTSCNLKDGKRDTKTDSIRKRQIRDGCMTGQTDYGQNETKKNWRGIRILGVGYSRIGKITLIEGGRRRQGGAGGLKDDRKGRGLKHVSSFKL